MATKETKERIVLYVTGAELRDFEKAQENYSKRNPWIEKTPSITHKESFIRVQTFLEGMRMVNNREDYKNTTEELKQITEVMKETAAVVHINSMSQSFNTSAVWVLLKTVISNMLTSSGATEEEVNQVMVNIRNQLHELDFQSTDPENSESILSNKYITTLIEEFATTFKKQRAKG